jgi:hypothetical protein
MARYFVFFEDIFIMSMESWIFAMGLYLDGHSAGKPT